MNKHPLQELVTKSLERDHLEEINNATSVGELVNIAILILGMLKQIDNSRDIVILSPPEIMGGLKYLPNDEDDHIMLMKTMKKVYCYIEKNSFFDGHIAIAFAKGKPTTFFDYTPFLQKLKEIKDKKRMSIEWLMLEFYKEILYSGYIKSIITMPGGNIKKDNWLKQNIKDIYTESNKKISIKRMTYKYVSQAGATDFQVFISKKIPQKKRIEKLLLNLVPA